MPRKYLSRHFILSLALASLTPPLSFAQIIHQRDPAIAEMVQDVSAKNIDFCKRL